jgi:hypothetical protein
MNRKIFWAVLVVGLALVVAPFAMSLPGKAAAGQRMLNGFQPIMQPAQVQTTAYYYNQVFVPLGRVTPMMSAQNLQRFQALMAAPALAGMLRGMPQAQQAFGILFGTMQKNVGIFRQVPAGLRHYEPLVTTMQANVDNFKQVNSLPDFRLFTWFFVVPGALLIVLAGIGLYGPLLTGRIAFHDHVRPTPA